MIRPNSIQIAHCERLLRELVASQQGLEACLVASDDGFEVACVSRMMSFSPSRLAALTSSAKALSSAVLGEASCGDMADLVIDGSQGRMVLHPLSDERLLCLIANSEATVSALRQRARNTAADINALFGQNEAWISRLR